MNSRTLVIVIVAGFALCCIGSGAVMTLSVLEKALVASKTTPPEPVAVAPKGTESDDTGDTDDDAPVAPPADTDDSPDDDETIPTANDDDDEAPGYVAPEEGVSTFAVYYAKKSKLPVAFALQAAARGTSLHALKKGEPVETAESPFIAVEEQTTLDYPVNAEALDAAELLDAPSRKLLATSQSVAVLTVITSGAPGEERDAQKAVLAFAKATGGVLWDDDSAEFMSLNEFKARRLDSWNGALPRASSFFTVVHNPGAKSIDLATRGLQRFALPELELHDVSRADEELGTRFLAIVAQTLVERQDDPIDDTSELDVSVAALQNEAVRTEAQSAVGSGSGAVKLHFKAAGDEDLPALQVVLPAGGLRAFFGN